MDNKIKEEIDGYYRYYLLGLDIIEDLYRNSHHEEALRLCMDAAWFCRFNYCGFYTDSRIEDFLLKAGEDLDTLSVTNKIKPVPGKKLKILHVATEIYDTGGHTREFEHWIKFDSGNQHDVFLTDQNAQDIPDFFEKTVLKNGGTIYKYTRANSFIERVSILRNMANQYDMVVLHLHPNDIIAILAMAKGVTAPVAFHEHADFLFWVGSCISDCLIELRENYLELSKQRRHIDKAFFLPIVLPVPEKINYQEARAKLKIADRTVLLCIAHEAKLAPVNGKNFFEDIIPVLSNHPETVLFIAGLEPSSSLASRYKHPQIVYAGVLKDIEIYKDAADIYVDCYPVTSMRAVLEVGMWHMPVLRMYNPASYSEYTVQDYKHPLYYPKNSAEWQKILASWIEDKNLRKQEGEKVFENMMSHHTGDNWLTYLNNIYKNMVGTAHKTHRVKGNVLFYTKAEEDLLEIYRKKHFANIYFIRYFGKVSLKYKFKILFNSKSFNLHSAKLLVYYFLGIKEKKA